MKIDRRLFQSKLAHRVFLAFVVCALVPIGIVGALSYRSVTNQLIAQASSRLRQASKALGLSLYERLLFAEVELATVSRALAKEPDAKAGWVRGDRLSQIETVDLSPGSGAFDRESSGGVFQQHQREAHLEIGKATLLPFPDNGASSPVRLALRLDPADPESKMVVGEVDPNYLWGLDGGNSVPADAQFCVYEGSGRLIYGSFDGCRDAWFAVQADQEVSSDAEKATVFPVSSMSGERYVGGHRELFLGARFFARDWMIVVCEPRSAVVRPIERWRLVFPAVVLLASWVVLLVIISVIRKNLDPIDRFREATVRLARRDFDFEVDVTTGDEFEQLADAFNQMSTQLRRQFGALAASGRLHRAILSSLDAETVVEAAVSGAADYFECDRVSIIVFEGNGEGLVRTSARGVGSDFDHELELVVTPDLLAKLERVPEGSVIGHDLPVPSELIAILDLTEMESVLAVPVAIRGSIAALIGLGFLRHRVLPEDELDHLTQLADQFAVALSNARMLNEVNNFSLGTLEALARAVDAKSPWTAGHSERVTQLAVNIGAVYGLDSFELAKLYRGAMLHDIGKLGISQTLLDKKGRLDHSEFDIVRSHTMIGERILEPVGAFAEIMPVVTQHHERFDGSGYPNGLIGSAIDIKARILAVADVFDAMTNPRPYRSSVDPLEVIEMIRRQAGTQFDPDVVDAFLRAIESRGGIDQLVMLKSDHSIFAPHQHARWRADEPQPMGNKS